MKLPKTTSTKTQSTIRNPNEFLQIPGTNYIIIEYEPDRTKGFDYETSHERVLQNGWEIPQTSLFIPHFLNVVLAYHNKSKLYDSLGNEVTGERLKDLYKHLTGDYIVTKFSSWLNGKLVPGTGFNGFDLETVTGLDSNGNLLTKKTPLEECLMEDCYINLNPNNFNSQGFPIPKAKSKYVNYNRGKNIYYFYPKKDCVAGFGSFSFIANLGSWDPYNSSDSTGVCYVCKVNA